MIGMIEKYLDAEELRRLLRSLIVFLGALAVFLLFAMIVVPGIRNANRPAAPPPVAPAAGDMGWLDPAEAPPMKGYEIPPLDPKTVLSPTPELLERGRSLYGKNCAQCHGDAGLGNGPGALGVSPPPRNLTSPEGWKNGHGIPGIFKTLSEGIRGSSMAAYDTLAKRDRMALVHLVRSLGKFPHGPDEPAAMEAFSAQLAGAAEKVPNKIPVSRAMALLEKEFAAAAPLALPAPEDRSPGAEALRRAVADPARAAQALAGSPDWRKGIAELSAAIVPGAPGNGFSVRAAAFGPAEWQALLGELENRMR